MAGLRRCAENRSRQAGTFRDFGTSPASGHSRFETLTLIHHLSCRRLSLRAGFIRSLDHRSCVRLSLRFRFPRESAIFLPGSSACVSDHVVIRSLAQTAASPSITTFRRLRERARRSTLPRGTGLHNKAALANPILAGSRLTFLIRLPILHSWPRFQYRVAGLRRSTGKRNWPQLRERLCFMHDHRGNQAPPD